MLINFTIKNYKSYKQLTNFTMKKSPRIRDLSYSILYEKIKSNKYNILCSSVLYGANASGKSNINDALFTLKTIILHGNIKNSNIIQTPTAQTNLELVPFIFSEKEPVEFEIEFIYHNVFYQYKLSIDIGDFLSDTTRQIVYENLKINSQDIFIRDYNEIKKIEIIKDYSNDFISDADSKKILQMFNDTLVEDSLFLTNGFKNISKHFSSEIINWFESQLVIIPKLENVHTMPIVTQGGLYVDNFINEVAKVFGITGSKIAFIKTENSQVITSSLIKRNEETKQDFYLPAQIVESFGTNRIIQLLPIVLDVIKRGATLAIDELDVALHPMLMMNIISLFHNDEINKNQAQLIFNTHNPIYLNNSVFRRDEIKFVEKDLETHESIIYSLADFGTKGKQGVRNTTDYIKNYFMNKYGAIINIDYTDIFKKYVERGKNETKNE